MFLLLNKHCTRCDNLNQYTFLLGMACILVAYVGLEIGRECKLCKMLFLLHLEIDPAHIQYKCCQHFSSRWDNLDKLRSQNLMCCAFQVGSCNNTWQLLHSLAVIQDIPRSLNDFQVQVESCQGSTNLLGSLCTRRHHQILEG